MIDCPICHVKNHDDARFCAECGQRLSGPGGQSAAPTEAAPPPPRQQPPQTPQAQPPERRLHSPLLDDAAGEGDMPPHHGGGVGPSSASAEVQRLRQMSSRQQDPPAAPDRQFKNPYDPRNDPRNLPPEGSAPQHNPEQQRKLRSPLLSGEEFDEADFPDQEPQGGGGRGGNLRSPMLGGGESGGSGFRSPLLGSGGRQQQFDDIDEEAPTGGGLRSPLLGGGGGGAGYGGNDRRRLPNTDAPYQGSDRRRGGLRSPILGGGDDEYEDDYYEDEPVDEDNPNVLRSPLLAAKRPLNDRPRNEPTPATSNMQNPPKPGQMPDLGPNVQNPSSSYTSLRAIKTQGTPAPQAVPPAPSDQPSMAQRPAGPGYPGQPGGPSQSYPNPTFGQPVGPATQAGLTQPQGPQTGPAQGPQTGPPQGSALTSQAAANAAQPPQQQLHPQQQQPPQSQQQSSSAPPTSVPPSFLKGGIAGPTPPNPSVPTAQPVRRPETEPYGTGGGGGINIQAPTPSRSMPSYASGDSALDQRPGTKPKSKLLSGYAEDDDDEEYTPATRGRGDYQMAAGPPSPIPKIIGGVTVLLLLLKAWAFKDFLSTDWNKIAWLVTDQLVTMGVIICLAVLAFTRRD